MSIRLTSASFGTNPPIAPTEPIASDAWAPRSQRDVFLPPGTFVGWLLPDAITQERAAEMLANLSARGFDRTGDRYPANYRNNDRLVFDDSALASALFEMLRDRLPQWLDSNGLAIAETTEDEDHWELCGLNPRFRACRYADGQSFCVHRDGPYAPSDDVRSFLTVQLYLDEDPTRVGGHTRFYADPRGHTRWASIAPRAGAAIVFDHRAWHDGEPVTAGIKHVVRTDAIYRRVPARRRSRVESTTTDAAPPTADIVGAHRGYAWQAIALRSGTSAGRSESIASVGRDGTMRRWSRRDGSWSEQIVDLACGSVTCVVEDIAERVWCGARSGEIFVVTELFGRPRVERLAADLGAITSATRANDRVAFTTSRGQVIAFDASSSMSNMIPTPAWVAFAHEEWAWGIAAHDDGFLSCGHDGRVTQIDRDGRARLWAELGAPVRAIVTTERGARNATGMRELAAIVGDERGWLHWLSRGGTVIRSQRAHAATVTSVAIDHDRLVSASEDGTVKVWSTNTNAEGVVVLAAKDFITSVAFDTNGDLISAGYDGAIRRIRAADS